MTYIVLGCLLFRLIVTTKSWEIKENSKGVGDSGRFQNAENALFRPHRIDETSYAFCIPDMRKLLSGSNAVVVPERGIRAKAILTSLRTAVRGSQ